MWEGERWEGERVEDVGWEDERVRGGGTISISTNSCVYLPLQ